MKPGSARKNQPPTGEGKKQSTHVGEPNKLNKRSVVLQSSSAKENIFSISLDEMDAAMPPGIEVLKKEETRLLFHLHENQSSNNVLQHFISQGNTILAFEEILPSLNDIFIRQVQGTAAARAFVTV